MKILHCCLACFYIDNYGYQENILPKQHKLDGHEVEIVASTETYVDHKNLAYVAPQSYMSESSIPVTRLPYSRYLPKCIAKKIRIYEGISDILDRFLPEIIFVHDCQFVDIMHIASYARKRQNVRIYVDCHADLNNSAKNWLSKFILHKIIYRCCAKMIEPYTTRFYGVLPARCNFLHDMYGIPREKIELLVLGAEDKKIRIQSRDGIRTSICSESGINPLDFIIVTGGKLNKRKNIIALLDAVRLTKTENIKLLIFGSIADDIMEVFERKLNNPKVKYIGWIKADRTYDYLISADLVVFPGSHSVLWEQSVACGVPCFFRHIEGMNHVDTGGNCIFLKEGRAKEIAENIDNLVRNKPKYEKMKKCALNGSKQFLYSDIARRAIRD
ncbi:MAG: glycosyltransferase family 4 protein [Syntrophorhabdaceae bacterium]